MTPHTDSHGINSLELPDMIPEGPVDSQTLNLQVRRIFSRYPILLTYVAPLRVPQILQIYHELFQEQPLQGNASPPSQPEPQTAQQVHPFRVIYRHSQPRHSRHPASCTTDLSWAVSRPTSTGQCASALTTRTTGGATSTSLSGHLSS